MQVLAQFLSLFAPAQGGEPPLVNDGAPFTLDDGTASAGSALDGADPQVLPGETSSHATAPKVGSGATEGGGATFQAWLASGALRMADPFKATMPQDAPAPASIPVPIEPREDTSDTEAADHPWVEPVSSLPLPTVRAVTDAAIPGPHHPMADASEPAAHPADGAPEASLPGRAGLAAQTASPTPAMGPASPTPTTAPATDVAHQDVTPGTTLTTVPTTTPTPPTAPTTFEASTSRIDPAITAAAPQSPALQSPRSDPLSLPSMPAAAQAGGRSGTSEGAAPQPVQGPEQARAPEPPIEAPGPTGATTSRFGVPLPGVPLTTREGAVAWDGVPAPVAAPPAPSATLFTRDTVEPPTGDPEGSPAVDQARHGAVQVPAPSAVPAAVPGAPKVSATPTLETPPADQPVAQPAAARGADDDVAVAAADGAIDAVVVRQGAQTLAKTPQPMPSSPVAAPVLVSTAHQAMAPHAAGGVEPKAADDAAREGTGAPPTFRAGPARAVPVIASAEPTVFTVATVEPDLPVRPAATALPLAPVVSPSAEAVLAAANIRAITEAMALGSLGDRIEVRLDPPELGRVSIDMAVDGNRVSAVVSADRPETLDLLRRHVDMLQRELGASGFGGADIGFADRRDSRQQGGVGPGGEALPMPPPRPASTHRQGGALTGAVGRLDIRL